MKWIKKRTKDPAIETNFQPAIIEEIANEAAYCYEGIYLSEDLYLSLAVVAPAGAFFFVPVDSEPDPAVVQKITMPFGLDPKTAVVFFHSEEMDYAVDWDSSVLELSDIYGAFGNLFTNLNRPYIDRQYLGMKTVKALIEKAETPEAYKDKEKAKEEFTYGGEEFEVVDEFYHEDTGELKAVIYALDTETVERLNRILSSLEGNERPNPKAKTKIGEDGCEYIRKSEAKKFWFIDTGLAGKEKWYRLSDENTDAFAGLTAILGWAGVHKFRMGQILAGILYFVTAGCAGVLPALDILQMATGGAFYEVAEYTDGAVLTRQTERVYLRKTKHLVVSLILMALALAIGLAIFRFGHMNFLRWLGGVISTTAETMAPMMTGE